MKKNTNLFTALPLIVNSLLVSIKVVAGFMFSSMVLIVDATNNFFDLLSAIIFRIGLKISQKDADENHPLGHGRAEYITSLLIGSFMIFVSIQFLIDSIQNLVLVNEETEFSVFVVWVVLSSFVLKGMLFLVFSSRYHHDRRMSSKTIALDSLGDVLIALVMLFGLTIRSFVPNFNVDAFLSLLVSGVIFFNGIRVVIKTSKDMLGSPLDPTLSLKIETILKRYPTDILGFHSVIYHDYGPEQKHVSFHVEVPDTLSLVYVHNLIDEIEGLVLSKTSLRCLIHADPMITNETFRLERTQKIRAFLITLGLESHQFSLHPVHEKHHPEMIIKGFNYLQVQKIKKALKSQFPEESFIFSQEMKA